MQILGPHNFDIPEDGFGLQQVVMEDVALGARAPTAIMWSSSQYMAPTSREKRLPGFERAVSGAEELGFPVMIRNSGGGAVAANAGSLSFSVTYPVEDLRHGLYERYEEGLDLISSALQEHGVAAEAGEVEGEFCPGAYSVRSGGVRGVKHAGLAQRVKRRAARLEALILVTDTAGLIPVLEHFYRALDLPFRPESIADMGASVPQVVEALTEQMQRRYEAATTTIDPAMLNRARAMRGSWRYVKD
ncbi:hypothetical protein BH23ACT11_BH23ACT11_13890 [soil metagenome]